MKRKINTDINKVYLYDLDSYDYDKVKDTVFFLISGMLDDNGITVESLAGKKVVLKPNLLAKREAEAGITAHPSFVQAAGEFFVGLGADTVIADSPGGVYNVSTLEGIYKVTGMNDAAVKSGAVTNKDTGYVSVHEPEASARKFNIINPLNEADLVVNLARLKTHALCEVSLSVKNMFGAIPGLQKAEQHARFPGRTEFADMLCDLCLVTAPQINIIDGVCGMEGNGPAGGTLKKVGAVIASANPFAADIVAAKIMGYNEKEVGTIDCAVKRGLCPESIGGLEIIGEDYTKYVSSFKRPDASAGGLLKQLPSMFGGKLQKFLEPKPVVNKKKCIGCGECMRNCPVSTIKIKDKKAEIEPKACIKCYCCQEFCPVKAIKVKSNFIFKL